LDLSNDLPVVVVVVDEADKIDSFIALIEPLVARAACGALLTRENLMARHIARPG
jgi:PII-like signaling protein